MGPGVCVNASPDPRHDLIEQLTLNQRATSSTLVQSTIFFIYNQVVMLDCK